MQKLEQLRKKIDVIDAAIIEKLKQRQKLTQQIGQYKALHNIPIKDRVREENLLTHYEELSEQHGLPPLLVTRLFKIIFTYSRKQQSK
ncbi:MAG TPA: chorismate mutase [Gammaproteobacteria bacterium]|nr:chorismate mutase [Gammaproteobacteria bacterium]